MLNVIMCVRSVNVVYYMQRMHLWWFVLDNRTEYRVYHIILR